MLKTEAAESAINWELRDTKENMRDKKIKEITALSDVPRS
jgi:hypothetical protein